MEDNNKSSNELNNPHDKFFKGAMGMKAVVDAYSRQFIPQDILDDLDLDGLEIDNTTYITDELSEFFADMVWRCPFKKGGRQARIAFLHEHKSYKPMHPHFQLLDYIRGAWRAQIQEGNEPVLMIPIVLYHGEAMWEFESLDSYFGKVSAKFLRFLPCFDYILVNLQNYPDATIRAFDSIFLQKTLLGFKHYLDKEYLKIHIVELLLTGYNDEKIEQNLQFIRMFTVYLTNISGMSSQDIKQAAKNHSDHHIKSEAMNLIDELIEEGEKKGIEKGIEKEKQNTIIRSWQSGIDMSMIANISGLSLAEVKKIIADFKLKN
jgi:predicted transposase/invertase (TIGR01784 family)